MLRDNQGLEVTTDLPKAITYIDCFIDQILSFGNNPEVIFKAVECDAKSVIANAYAATFHMLSETADASTQANPYLQAAYEHINHANEREKIYLQGINAWVNKDISQAIFYHEEIANKFPCDVFNIQIGQHHYLNIGNKQGLLQIVEKVLPANRENYYLYGMLAFGLEENQRFLEAEIAGRKATEMNRSKTCWAHHAVAHVLYSQGRLDEGIAWTELVGDVWKDTSFYTHQWWHTALYYFDQEDFRKVLELYDTHIWGTSANKQTALDLINAISLLMRLELAGVNAEDYLLNNKAAEGINNSINSRWKAVVNYVAGRIHEHILGFYDLHYIYSLARVGQVELVEEMLESMEVYAQTVNPYFQKVWCEVTIPASRGLVAYARGEWAKSAGLLEMVLPRLHEAGGSDAQRDLFEQIYLDCLISTEENERAFHLLKKRANGRDNIPATQRELARLSPLVNFESG